MSDIDYEAMMARSKAMAEETPPVAPRSREKVTRNAAYCRGRKLLILRLVKKVFPPREDFGQTKPVPKMILEVRDIDADPDIGEPENFTHFSDQDSVLERLDTYERKLRRVEQEEKLRSSGETRESFLSKAKKNNWFEHEPKYDWIFELKEEWDWLKNDKGDYMTKDDILPIPGALLKGPGKMGGVEFVFWWELDERREKGEVETVDFYRSLYAMEMEAEKTSRR